MIHEVVSKARTVVICVLLKGSDIETQRGSRFLSVMTSILRMLSPKGRGKAESIIVPLINNPNNFRSVKQMEA